MTQGLWVNYPGQPYVPELPRPGAATCAPHSVLRISRAFLAHFYPHVPCEVFLYTCLVLPMYFWYSPCMLDAEGACNLCAV